MSPWGTKGLGTIQSSFEMVFSSLECSLTAFSSLLLEPKSNQNQTDKGAHGHQFSSLLLKPKSNQTDEGAHGYQKQLESVKASAHLRWLFAQSSAHEKNALLSGISSFKILL